jgi:ketosteroid isomerase-like protein
VPESAAARTGIARPTEGLEAVKSIYARGPERYEHLRFEPTLVIADDDGAAVFARSHGKLRDGREFSNEYAFFYRVVDGRVTEVWEHPDTAYAFDFFGI